MTKRLQPKVLATAVAFMFAWSCRRYPSVVPRPKSPKVYSSYIDLSSAKAEILHEIFDPGNCMPLISRSKQTFLINGSKHNIYNKGDKLQPCFTDREIFTGSEIKLFIIILEFKSVYNIFIQLIKFGPKLYFSNTLNKNV